MSGSDQDRTKGLILNKFSLIGGRRPNVAFRVKYLNGSKAVETRHKGERITIVLLPDLRGRRRTCLADSCFLW